MKELVQHIPQDAAYDSNEVRILQKTWCRGKLCRPWSIHFSGDMHLLVLHFMVHKGPLSVAMTKVEGHANREHILVGVTTDERALANNKADANADKGQEMHGEGIVNLQSWLQERHGHFEILMRGIQSIIIDMVHENKRLRRQKLMQTNPFAKEAPAEKVKIPKQLNYGQRSRVRLLKFRPLPTGEHRMMAHNSNLINIRNYLAHHKWDLPQANVSGVIWPK